VSVASGRAGSATGRLARLGFAEPARAQRLLAEPALAGLVDPLEDVFDDGVLVALSETADPDLALLGLVRLLESLYSGGGRSRGRGTASGSLRKPGVVGGHRAVLGDAQDLPGEDVPAARVGVLGLAVERVGQLAAAIAHADVEVAVLAKLQVAAVMVAVRRGNVVQQHHLARGNVAARERVHCSEGCRSLAVATMLSIDTDSVEALLRQGRHAFVRKSGLAIYVRRVHGQDLGSKRRRGSPPTAARGVEPIWINHLSLPSHRKLPSILPTSTPTAQWAEVCLPADPLIPYSGPSRLSLPGAEHASARAASGKTYCDAQP
jgi:hypothetical protein